MPDRGSIGEKKRLREPEPWFLVAREGIIFLYNYSRIYVNFWKDFLWPLLRPQRSDSKYPVRCKRSDIRIFHGRAWSAIDTGVFTLCAAWAWGGLGEGICPRVATWALSCLPWSVQEIGAKRGWFWDAMGTGQSSLFHGIDGQFPPESVVSLDRKTQTAQNLSSCVIQVQFYCKNRFMRRGLSYGSLVGWRSRWRMVNAVSDFKHS